MSATAFFIPLASIVLAALLFGWLASMLRSAWHGVIACIALAALLAASVLVFTRDLDTQGFGALLVIGTFMFCSMIACSSSLALRRWRSVRRTRRGQAPEGDSA